MQQGALVEKRKKKDFVLQSGQNITPAVLEISTFYSNILSGFLP